MATWGKATPMESLRLLGYWPIAPLAIAKSFGLTALLFAGPLFEKAIVEGGWREWIRGRHLTETFGSWIGWRNYVAVSDDERGGIQLPGLPIGEQGPVTEEIVFRSTIIPLHILAKISPERMVFLTPLYFGIAHVHHFYEYRLTHPHTPLLPALLRVVIQFAYTSLFGFYATFIFLRTGSLPAVVLAHSFCNLCGLPRVWGRVEAGIPIGPPVPLGTSHERDLADKDKDKTERDLRRDGQSQVTRLGLSQVGVGSETRLSLVWSIVYYILLVAGAVAFHRSLWVLTESPSALLAFNRRSVNSGK